MVTVRHKIIKELKNNLEGYNWRTLDSPLLYAGRTRFDTEDEPLPIVTIVAGLEYDIEQTAYNTNFRKLPVEISALVSLEDGAETTEICEPVFGELEKAVFNKRIEINEQTFNIYLRGGGIADYPEQLGSAVLIITLSVDIHYETVIGNPSL